MSIPTVTRDVRKYDHLRGPVASHMWHHTERLRSAAITNRVNKLSLLRPEIDPQFPACKANDLPTDTRGVAYKHFISHSQS